MLKSVNENSDKYAYRMGQRLKNFGKYMKKKLNNTRRNPVVSASESKEKTIGNKKRLRNKNKMKNIRKVNQTSLMMIAY